MRRLLFVVAIGLIACGPNPAPTPSPTGGTSSTATALLPSSPDVTCQTMAHVYNPQRLKIMQPCVHVRGIIEIVRVEPDGDYHILVHINPTDPTPYGSWINDKNLTLQHGDLVTEPVCVHTVTQADAIAACDKYTNTTKIPKVGDHVRVSGPWVLDSAHGWFEIHPATYEILPAFTVAGGD